MDFAFDAATQQLATQVRAFIDAEVIPREPLATHPDGLPPEQWTALQNSAKTAGIWAPQLPRELGGLDLTLLQCVPVFEAAGRSLLGPRAINCAAPDEGNMHLLHLFATTGQRERYLGPLMQGTIRSAFAMTEPAPGAGSDPTMIKTSAVLEDDTWIIEGHKWYTTGADGAAFLIVMARTDADVAAADGCTLFLVEADNPGLKIVRRIEGLGVHTPGGHCEVRLTACRVPQSAVLGEVGKGFALTQHRLGPARLTHCMRWIGVAQRALEIATEHAKQRHAFGTPLAHHQSIQWMLADSEVELHAARLMVQQAAWLIESGNQARRETSMCKVFVAEAINRVIDRAIQICGSLGISDDLPLAQFYSEARAFRIYDGASEVHRMVIARGMLREAGAKTQEPKIKNRE
jgi:acyl-CoA dehydrogenase